MMLFLKMVKERVGSSKREIGLTESQAYTSFCHLNEITVIDTVGLPESASLLLDNDRVLGM